MNPITPEEMAPEELLEEVDALQSEIEEVETKPWFQKYLEAKAKQESCAALLRQRTLEVGNFRSNLFQFSKIQQEKTDWKAICRHLVENKAVKTKDMENAIEAFTEKKEYGKMLRIRDKDLSLKLV